MLGGKLKFFKGLLTASGKLYVDLSNVANGSAKVLLLADLPDQVQMLTLKGKLEIDYLDASGNPTVVDPKAGSASTTPTGSTISPAPNDSVGLQQLEQNQYIDVVFQPPGTKKLDTQTILDTAPEIELVSPTNVTYTLTAPPTQPDGFAALNKFRYAIPESVPFTTGTWKVRFIAGSFADDNGTPNTPGDGTVNLASFEEFVIYKPVVTLAAPAADASIDRAALNQDGKLQVRFRPVPGRALNPATILDTNPEFTLSGAVGTVVLGQPVQSTDDPQVFIYPFTGSFDRGAVTINFTADSYEDDAGNKNAAATETFTVTGATARISSASVGVDILNRQRYIDIDFLPTFTGSLTDSSISDETPEFALSGTAASAVTLIGTPVRQSNGRTWRYAFTGDFNPGLAYLSFSSDAFTDSLGNSNLAFTQTLTIQGVVPAAESPAVGTKAALKTLNNRGFFDIRYTGVGGTAVKPDSVLDTAPEFTLSGTGKGTAAITSVEKFDDDTYRYHFSGAFVAGDVKLTFADNVVEDVGGFGNVASTQFWSLTDLTPELASPLNGGRVSSNDLNASHTIDVTFPDTFGNGLDATSITDSPAEFVIKQRLADGTIAPISGVSVDGTGAAVAGSPGTWRFNFSGNLPDTATIVIEFLDGSWQDQAQNLSIAATAEFFIFQSSSSLEIKLQGSLEVRLPFIELAAAEDNVIFGVYGNATLKATTTRVSLDFSGSAEMLYIGTIGATAGKFVLEMPADGDLEFWGVARIDTNFAILRQYGVDAELYALLQINSSSSVKQETLTLKGQAEDGSDLTETYVLDPRLFRIEAGGSLTVKQPPTAVGQPPGPELATISGAFSIEVSGSGLKAFAAGQLKFGPPETQILSLQAIGVLSITDLGVALDVQISSTIGATGPLADIFSMQQSGHLVLNTTSVAAEVNISNALLKFLPTDYVATLTTSNTNPSVKSAKIPAGPPRRNDTNGPAGPYVVAELSGSLIIGGAFSIEGSMWFELSSSRISVEIDGTLKLEPIGALAINGTLQVTAAGVVGGLQLVATMELGPASLKGAAQLEINSTLQSAEIVRRKFNFATNSVSTETETVSVPALTRRIFISGVAEIEYAVRLSGTFEMVSQITLDGPKLMAYIDGSVKLGPQNADILQFDVTGLLYWQGTDFAMSIVGKAGLNVPGVKINTTLTVSMNTSQQDITYTVPAAMQALSGKSTFTIPAGPPLLGGGNDPAALYIVAMGTGTLDLASQLTINGEFRFAISTEKVDLFVGGTIIIDSFGSLGVSGNFQLGTNGAAGALSIAVSAGISGAGIALSGVMQLEFNTGPNSATVRTLDISPVTGAVT
ncbi:MAG: hypothetical protein RLZZ536_1015, partial [Planctomycetota bacterium]